MQEDQPLSDKRKEPEQSAASMAPESDDDDGTDDYEMQSKIVYAIDKLKRSLAAQIHIVNSMFIHTPNTQYFKITDDVHLTMKLELTTKDDKALMNKDTVLAQGKSWCSLAEVIQEDATAFSDTQQMLQQSKGH